MCMLNPAKRFENFRREFFVFVLNRLEGYVLLNRKQKMQISPTKSHTEGNAKKAAGYI